MVAKNSLRKNKVLTHSNVREEPKQVINCCNCRLTAVTQLTHHGMIFVPLGYTFGKGMYEMGEVKGGSPYGSGTYAADGSREPTELEIQQANYHGKYFAGIAKKLKKRSTV